MCEGIKAHRHVESEYLHTFAEQYALCSSMNPLQYTARTLAWTLTLLEGAALTELPLPLLLGWEAEGGAGGGPSNLDRMNSLCCATKRSWCGV